MIRSTFLSFLILGVIAPSAYAAPDFDVTFLGTNGSGNFEFRADVISGSSGGSTEVEMAFNLDSLFVFPVDIIIDVEVNTAVFDFENPGYNPFTGTVTTGLWVGPSGNVFFSAYGSQILASDEVVELLTVETEAIPGLFVAYDGLVAQQGVNHYFDGVAIVPEPATAVLAMGVASCLACVRRRRV
ncbi:hypothetical protein Mal64_31380 [Pseudobythopirellula maris]|uniref:PEP-CTERM protein-sorting domain-containing protein n=1 Tax=Pseudobythopirellula maris TaxID=2527991 RepID=A0A5C5ZK72_9BACT|nr:hypothetical protein [Pseudobythopirellula maris]TWT87596.1 hypothetical protein Mal64_31380 [Pseudobythopirellula maris]